MTKISSSADIDDESSPSSTQQLNGGKKKKKLSFLGSIVKHINFFSRIKNK
jgi:hypothetical protein